MKEYSTAIRYAITHLFHLKLIIKTFHLFHAHFNMIFFVVLLILWSTHMLYVISRCFSIIHPWHHHYSGGTTRSHHFEYGNSSVSESKNFLIIRMNEMRDFEAWAITVYTSHTLWREVRCVGEEKVIKTICWLTKGVKMVSH